MRQIHLPSGAVKRNSGQYPKGYLLGSGLELLPDKTLGGATFQLRYLGGASGTGGTVIGQRTTGANGMALWTGLEPGAYIVEVRP